MQPISSQQQKLQQCVLYFEFLIQSRAKCYTIFPKKFCGAGGQDAAFFSYHVCDLHAFGFAKGEMLPNIPRIFGGKAPLNCQVRSRAKCCPFFPVKLVRQCGLWSFGLKAGRNAAHFFPRNFAIMRSLETWAQSRTKCCPIFSQENVCNHAVLNLKFQNRAKCCTVFPQENFCNNAIFEFSGSGGQNAAFFHIMCVICIYSALRKAKCCPIFPRIFSRQGTF